MFGGNSVEHEISILTALSAMEHLSAERYEAIPCYVSKQGELYHGPMLKKLSCLLYTSCTIWAARYQRRAV